MTSSLGEALRCYDNAWMWYSRGAFRGAFKKGVFLKELIFLFSIFLGSGEGAEDQKARAISAFLFPQEHHWGMQARAAISYVWGCASVSPLREMIKLHAWVSFAEKHDV